MKQGEPRNGGVEGMERNTFIAIITVLIVILASFFILSQEACSMECQTKLMAFSSQCLQPNKAVGEARDACSRS
jgi:hypothetical protein